MKTRSWRYLAGLILAAALWSWFCGGVIGSQIFTGADKTFQAMAFAMLVMAWIGGMAIIFRFMFKYFRIPSLVQQAEEIVKSPHTMPGFIYICPACDDEFHKPGLCPKDFVTLVEYDKVEDRRVEDL